MTARRFDEHSGIDRPRSFSRALIGTSLTAASDDVVRSSLAVARALGSQVYLLHVTRFEPIGFGFEDVLGVDTLPSLNSQRESDLADQIRRSGVLESELVDAEVIAGPAHQALADAATSNDADLIFVGASEGHDPSDQLLGSTTDRLIRCAHCPVLILRNEMNLPPRRVLAPVDFSPTSALAMRNAVRFLEQMEADNTSSIESLFVLSERTRQLATQFSPQQVDRMAREELLRFTFEHTSGWDGTIETRVRIGDARSQLQEELDETPVDLVVVGSHGHGRVHRALIGSVAGKIARHARCSVLFVPNEQDSPPRTKMAARPDHIYQETR